MGSVRSADEVCKTLGISAADTSPGALEKMQNNFKLIGEEIIRVAEKHDVIEKYTTLNEDTKGLRMKIEIKN
ncbi:uncharacterized protein OCT59_006964 [Rhizophagus irregularis]|uniref:uncharacterized protein n=1 Tax=Rhizophagus irregularis TaxID=588596 RepID=UPI00331E1BF4|nr:hypothetical protein OCT59_006964 [Rhizophagus irregularis]